MDKLKCHLQYRNGMCSKWLATKGREDLVKFRHEYTREARELIREANNKWFKSRQLKYRERIWCKNVEVH